MVEWCIHISNVFYLASFLGRDMLWLRILTCAGLIFGIIFFSCQPMSLYGPTMWSVAFLIINGIQIRQLILERRRLMLTNEQRLAAEATFRNLSRDELLTLLTRVMFASPKTLRDLRRICQERLTHDEQALRDIAFSRLSRKELLNILIRRLWKSIVSLSPGRQRPLPGSAPSLAGGPVLETARQSAAT
jgi:Popeye protein conserved region